MQAIEITSGIHWVGAIDWDLRDFHGFETHHGTSYNAYLVQGETGVALVDTVKEPFVEELLARIASVVAPEAITHIVVNHLEPDHNSGLRAVIAAFPGARVIASPGGARAIGEYHEGVEADAVKDDVIDLGGVTLRFMPVPMVHWPDSMFTWCEERRVLLPNDGFGQHLASSERFADELGADEAIEHAHMYFANILMPLTTQVGKAIEKVVAAGWAPEVIAPSHGVAWRGDDVGRIIDTYQRWCANETSERVVIAFTTMWDSTRALAHAIAEGVAAEGVHCDVFDLADTPFSDITRAVMDSRAVLFGSAALHHGMLYRMAGYLQYLGGLKPAGKKAGVFGSYGWNGGAVEQMSERIATIGLEQPWEALTVKFKPTAADLESAAAWGREVAKAIR